MSQKANILEALQAGERLTPIQALARFQCFTLAQRVKELRNMGFTIHSELIPNREGGRKRIAVYWMNKGESHAESTHRGEVGGSDARQSDIAPDAPRREATHSAD